MKYKITIIYYAWLFKEFLKDMQGKFYFPFIVIYSAYKNWKIFIFKSNIILNIYFMLAGSK